MNLIIQQSGAVDSAKTPVLDMNNLNIHTFNASIAISLLQDSKDRALNLEYNSFFLSQEIIRDYVEEIANLSDTLNEVYVSDRKLEVSLRLIDKYKKRIGGVSIDTKGKSFNPKSLKQPFKTEDRNSVEYVS